ncbi:hypothetical protein CERZMDRAFT_101378 [Cercospora zeae-maydis SCOH1-5]|uniref:Acyltransferase 3 domain-containing protein n=1 Tax=Cercospora zeae-maydis SCOH1-5 TaxID=717836 RepID=A0A6A6F5D2_9PEZI|nr:hypothetical protein CERZMDRAFT_101378 [Cercospora zeae-maydis SCOH1-5]
MDSRWSCTIWYGGLQAGHSFEQFWAFTDHCFWFFISIAHYGPICNQTAKFSRFSLLTTHPILRTRLGKTVQHSFSKLRPLHFIRRFLLRSGPSYHLITLPVPETVLPVSRTASYDGLRGVACLIVFNFHFLYPYTKTITHGFRLFDGPDGDVTAGHPLQLPILCLLVRGRAMVTLFFAISGYVLSYSFLSATQTADAESMKRWTRLSSLTLRRWMRLFLPATTSMLIVMVATYLGAFDAGREFQKSSPWLTGSWEQHPPRRNTFGAQLEDFSWMWWDWQTPFQWRLYYSWYDPHTWTIPVEFRGSIVLFVLLLGSAGLKQSWRKVVFAFVTVYCFASKRWDSAAFTSGALVADLHLWQGAASTMAEFDEKTSLPRWRRGKVSGIFVRMIGKHVRTALKTMLFVTSLWILSFPDDEAWITPGFSWLNDMTPSSYDGRELRPYMFWHAFAASFILWSVQRLHYIQAFFCLSIPQYLGRLSYAFYLVHGPLLHGIGFALQPKIFEAFGAADSNTKWVGALMLGWMIMLTLSISVAHMFWKVVDMPLVRLAKWMERKLS